MPEGRGNLSVVALFPLTGTKVFWGENANTASLESENVAVGAVKETKRMHLSILLRNCFMFSLFAFL